MNKIIVVMSVSIDGFFEGPEHDISWHLIDEEVHAYLNEQLAPMSAFIDGRVTYELMADFWPTADADPAVPAVVAEFARIWRGMPKYVFSRTLENAEWGTEIIREVVPEEIMRLKAEAGGDLALGGASLVASFRRHDLIDEYRLYVQPVVLGSGTPLFATGDAPFALHLEEARTFGNGVVMLRYTRP